MDSVKSIRLPPDLMTAIHERARRERVDDSTAIRQLIGLGAEQYAVRLYKDGLVTLNQAAKLAGTTVRDFLELLWSQGVRGNVTMEQAREALETALTWK